MLTIRLIGTFIILSIVYEDYKNNITTNSLKFLLTIIRKHIVLIVSFSLLIMLSILTNPIGNTMNWGIMYLHTVIKNIDFFDNFMGKILTVFNALLAISILNGN
jgi:hypothetical protein